VVTLSDGRRRWCDEDKDLVGGAIGRHIVVCWLGLLAPQRKGTIGCSANLSLIAEKRARRGHSPGTISSGIPGAGAHTATSTPGLDGLGPAASATANNTSGADGSDTLGPVTDTGAV
jgi:hypothetical protein